MINVLSFKNYNSEIQLNEFGSFFKYKEPIIQMPAKIKSTARYVIVEYGFIHSFLVAGIT